MIQQLEPDLFLIDLGFEGFPGLIASYLLVDGDDLTLIETGPTTTSDTLLAGVRAAGFEPERITRLVVTHIHLDHAGAAGSLLRELPRARLFVHRAGVPHMADPSRLLASAARIFGENMERYWGEVLPVPKERMVVLEDGARIRAGERVLTALHTPGHAPHHLAFLDEGSGDVFTGDVAAVRLDRSAYLRPPALPPETDLALWRRSIARLRALAPRRLYLTHFGAFDDADEHLDGVLTRLFFLAGWTEGRLAAEPDTAAFADELVRREADEVVAITGKEDLVELYELVISSRMNVEGLARYLRKKRG